MSHAALATLPTTLPDYSLGDHVTAWMERWLRSPADPRQPLQLTAEQVRFLLWWYAVDSAGRWVYRRGVLRRPKGWGKDPLCACICLAELLGPVRFERWDGGLPVGQPANQALVQVGAVSEAQTRTTTLMLAPLVSDALQDKHRLDIGDKRVKGTVNGQEVELRPVTASARSAEGARVTAFVSNEIQHWLASNGGHAMSKVIRRNLAKSPDGASRELSITNAHEPGEGSVAEMDDDAWREQQKNGGGDILLDTREPILGADFTMEDTAALTAALTCAYGDSYWVDLRRIVAECRDPQTSDAEAGRFYMNRLMAGARSWTSPSTLDAAFRETTVPPAGTPVALGFDGSRTQDATALVCTDMQTGFQWVAAVWERDQAHEDWEVPAHEVEASVERIFATWNVARFYCDPAWWQDEVNRWAGRWPGVACEWWMTGGLARRAARAVTGYRTALENQECTWGGASGDVFRRHALNAVARPHQAHVDDGALHTIAKPARHSNAYIDVAVAAVLSWQARGDAVAAGWAPKPTFRAYSPAASRRRRELRSLGVGG